MWRPILALSLIHISTQICQIDEADTPVSVVCVEAERVSTSISTMSESKSDSTAAMMQLLLNKFDEKFTNLNDKFDSFDIKFNELKNEIKGQNFHLEERINTVETRCDNIQKTTLAIDDKFSSKISGLDTKVDLIYDTVNNTVKSQLELQNTDIQQKCLNLVESQLEVKTNIEVSNQIEVKTNVLQNHLEKIEVNVIDITKNLETIDNTITEHERNTKSRFSLLQSKIKEIDDLTVQNSMDAVSYTHLDVYKRQILYC